jgi:multidrug efflux pump subunit AcrA (membrane-fusion protein)
MPAPLPKSGAPIESQAWQELEDIFTGLGQLARSGAPPQEFYRTVLDQCLRALSAVSGTVWLRAGSGPMQPVVRTGLSVANSLDDEAARRTHEALLVEAISAGRVITVAPRSSRDSEATNPTDRALLIGPVFASRARALPEDANSPAARRNDAKGDAAAIIELQLRADASPATYRGCEQFLAAVCEIAADFHAFEELRRLQQNETYRNNLLRLGRLVHAQLKVSKTAYVIANEGRRVLGCDRLSVLMARGRRCRLLAASGVSRVERRSSTARRIEKLAGMVRRTDEPAFYEDGQADALPPVAEVLEQHAEESHARHILAVPLRRPAAYSAKDSALLDESPTQKRKWVRPTFVLVAEQFDLREGEMKRDQLVEVGEVCTTALYNALDAERLPLGWLLRPLGGVTRYIGAHVPRTLLVVAAIAAAVATLVLMPADFNIEAPGTLQPIVQQDVFAPRDGLVDEVLVAHGETVKQGQPIVKMRDPALELELKRVDGELQTAQRQIDAVRATKTNRAVRDANPVDSYRLSAEERELQQKLTNLRRELDLLNHERDQLLVTSPIAGRVITWDVSHRLMARPVERGEVLVTVADPSSPWQLELNVADDRIGHVLAAQQEMQKDLTVRYRLSSDERDLRYGKIAEICQTADIANEKASRPKPTILVKVALDDPDLQRNLEGEIRPGVSARAQIACGRRPLGYVWLHDVWDRVQAWVKF